MSPQNHTPGPWTTKTSYDGERFIDETSGSTYTQVMPVNGSWPEEVICDVWGTEHDDEANARLIAAAPELLEAATALLSQLADCQITSVNVDALQDAVSKATVETKEHA